MATDLSSVLAGKSNVILCPLCLEEFGLNDLDRNLSEEHVIPDSAGGTLTTLTCSKCNSKRGSEIDSHFARAYRIEKARRTGGKVDARLKGQGIGAPAFIRFDSEGIHCELNPTTAHVGNVLLEKFQQYAKGERRLNLRFINNIDPSKLVASMVKAAYLGLFVDWGYRYPLLPMTDWVRRGIKHSGPERECFGKIVIQANITDVGELPKAPTRMSFEAICGGIRVPCSIINDVLGSGAFWVLLPPIGDLTSGNCASLERAADSIRGKSITITLNPNAPAVIREKA